MTPYQTNALQNGTQTVLLVKNFTGKAGDDLDTANGGTFTSTPWSEIGDTIAVSDGGSGDPTYAGAPVLTGKLIAGASAFRMERTQTAPPTGQLMTPHWLVSKATEPLPLRERFWSHREPPMTGALQAVQEQAPTQVALIPAREALRAPIPGVERALAPDRKQAEARLAEPAPRPRP